ncbi:MAG: Asp-tRNA(Asn)/Glu-tRNA(Gln) amidotransferase GatCAB subunit A [Chloroflexi bacterium]|nr:Asp-tRNA(Asn)/Glu-tRNA(Gln) amidotransferase GatCAB subunit A [Chloroflexota bacterium]|tara:strand:+ start:5885 stop:7333 length:1449 start_codon:yes stop_codon:yes gene_type:complete
MKDLLYKSIHEVAPLIRSGEISPVELTMASLEQIRNTDPQLNAFPLVKEQEAIAAARNAEAAIVGGNYLGPLHGIPVGLKDNIAVQDWVTTCGSPILREYVTDYDAAVVERLKDAGAVIIGKNNMHEWALAGSCTYSVFGTIHNPWDTNHTSGGSSGGSAAAVSSGQVFLSIGTDARASIRNPASYCGIVGHKPSTGLISRYGELPPTSSWYMVIGPLARTVRDAALAVDILSGYDSRDPNSLKLDPKKNLSSLDRDIQGLRIGLVTNYFFDDVTEDVEKSILQASKSFGELGAFVEEVQIPSLQYMQLIEPSFESENKSWLLKYALTRGDDFLHQDIRFRILAGAFARTIDHERASRLLSQVKWEVNEVFKKVDILLTPTNSTPAYNLTEREVQLKNDLVDVESANGQSRVTTRLTVPFNALGLPAISIPCGFASNGMPIGMQLIGRHAEDEKVINAAANFEAKIGPGYVKPRMIKTTDYV